METVMTYENITSHGRIKINVNCSDEREYNISVENSKWLYPKIENLLFACELFIRADPSVINQLNEILNKTIDDMRTLIEISKESK